MPLYCWRPIPPWLRSAVSALLAEKTCVGDQSPWLPCCCYPVLLAEYGRVGGEDFCWRSIPCPAYPVLLAEFSIVGDQYPGACIVGGILFCWRNSVLLAEFCFVGDQSPLRYFLSAAAVRCWLPPPAVGWLAPTTITIDLMLLLTTHFYWH